MPLRGFIGVGLLGLGATVFRPGCERGHDLIVRVAADAAEAALREPGTRPFDLTGRPMKGWLLVDADGHAEDDDLRRWVDRGLAYATSLPPK